MNPYDPGDPARSCRVAALAVSSPSAGSPVLLCLLFFVLFLLLCALCSAAQQAALTASSSKLRTAAESGSHRAKRALRIAEDSARFSVAMQSGRICFAAAGTGSLMAGLAPPLRVVLQSWGLGPAAGGVAAAALVLAAVLVLLPLGVRVPSVLAATAPETSLRRLAYPAASVRILLTPLSAVTWFCGRLAVRLTGGDPNAPEEDVTEEEIRMIVDAGEENGVLEETEKDMIANVLDFNDTTAGEVMTHRTDVLALEDTEPPAKLIELAIENGFSRLPVYHEDPDNVVGVCYVKDFLPYVGRPLPETLRITDHMRPAYFIPESKKCSQLFTEMTERKVQFAVVVDEYGGTAGIITLEDLVESILGNIQDEYDQEEESAARVLDENTFEVDGATSVDEIGDLTGEPLPEGDYDTVAGFVMEQLGEVPRENEHPSVSYRSLTFTVEQVEDRRITRLLIRRDPTLRQPAEETD